MRNFKLLLWLGFLFYIALLTKVILIKLPLSILLHHIDFGLNLLQINFVPFKTIISYFSHENIRVSVRNVAGNVIAFIPLGFLLPILISKFQKLKSLILISFGVSLTFELLQLIVPVFGSFDIDDLILNTFGALLGYFGFNVVKKFTLIREISSVSSK